MNGHGSLPARLHSALLLLYPRRFRFEYGEEMADVFAMGLQDAESGASAKPWRLLLREMRDWPSCLLREHLRERRGGMSSNMIPRERPLQRLELLAAMVAFSVLPILATVAAGAPGLPSWSRTTISMIALVSAASAMALAMARGLLRLSLPYLGMVLAVCVIYLRYDRVWLWIFPVFLEWFGPRSLWPLWVRIGYSGVFGLINLLSMLAAAFLVVNLLRLLPFTRSVWQRIRRDWTLLSLAIYGVLTYGIQALFDGYRYDLAWQLLALTFLALGAWLYLRTSNLRMRYLALVSGVTGVMWTVALAKWLLIPLQRWPAGYPISPSPTTRWVEVGSALVYWASIVGVMAIPALLNRLRQKAEISEVAGEGSVAA